jgi:hypothetical protein
LWLIVRGVEIAAVAIEVSDSDITNCIFWDNDATNYDQIYNDSSTVVVAYSDIEDGYAGTGNINSDPNFVDDTDPDGDDNIWITSDDGLRLDSPQPQIYSATTGMTILIRQIPAQVIPTIMIWALMNISDDLVNS